MVSLHDSRSVCGLVELRIECPVVGSLRESMRSKLVGELDNVERSKPSKLEHTSDRRPALCFGPIQLSWGNARCERGRVTQIARESYTTGI